MTSSRTTALLALCLSLTALAAPRRPTHFGPPKEATRACLNASQDAACSYELDGVKVSGTCVHAKPTELLSCQAPKAAAPQPPPAAK